MNRRDFVAAVGASGASGALDLRSAGAAAEGPRKGLRRERYRGVFAYPPTPFAADLSLDEEALRSNLRKLVRIGVDGIVLAGSTGEFYTLSDADHRRIAQILHEETRSRDVVSVVGAQGLTPGEVIGRARAAMEIGLDAVLAMQPFYLTLTRKELVAFWKQLSAACPDIGIIIYHYDWVRQEYPPEIFRELSVLPNLVGSKEGHYDFTAWARLQKESPMVHMSATDGGWLVEMYRMGAPGVGSVNLSLMPHIVHRILKLCGEGNFTEAEKNLVLFTELSGHLKSGSGRPFLYPSELKGWSEYGGTARSKALVDAFGFLKAGPPRPPGIPVPAEMQKRVRGYLESRYPELLPPPDFADTLPPGSKLWPAAKFSSTS